MITNWPHEDLGKTVTQLGIVTEELENLNTLVFLVAVNLNFTAVFHYLICEAVHIANVEGTI